MYESALAFSFEGKKWKLCSQAEDALVRLLGENPESCITYSEGNNQVDDSWKRFPDVGAALEWQIPYVRECFCIAACPSRATWAVGVSEIGRNRYQASRIALAIALSLQALDDGFDLDLTDVPSIADFVNHIRANDEEQEQEAPPSKRRKVV